MIGEQLKSIRYVNGLDDSRVLARRIILLGEEGVSDRALSRTFIYLAETHQNWLVQATKKELLKKRISRYLCALDLSELQIKALKGHQVLNDFLDDSYIGFPDLNIRYSK